MAESLRADRQVDEWPQPIGLVDVREPVLDELFERVYVCRELFHTCDTIPHVTPYLFFRKA